MTDPLALTDYRIGAFMHNTLRQAQGERPIFSLLHPMRPIHSTVHAELVEGYINNLKNVFNSGKR